MRRNILFILVSMFILQNPSYAEKSPICITPNQIISTQHDEVQIGDWIGFQVVNDVYLNDKLYIEKDTPMIGVVDFVHPNGWAKDSAEITFNEFYAVNVSNKKIDIVSPLKINDTTLLEDNLKEIIIHYVESFIRGSEIYIEPDTKTFNIFLTQ